MQSRKHSIIHHYVPVGMPVKSWSNEFLVSCSYIIWVSRWPVYPTPHNPINRIICGYISQTIIYCITWWHGRICKNLTSKKLSGGWIWRLETFATSMWTFKWLSLLLCGLSNELLWGDGVKSPILENFVV